MTLRAQAAEVRAQALEVAAGWSPPDAPGSWALTAALFRLIADHDGLLRRLAGLPADRLPALLGSAAICCLVRRDRAEPLARYFPEPGGPQPPLDQDFGPAGRLCIDSRLDEIMALCDGHRYQMNEVARCSQIAAGIAARSASAAPIALVDLGLPGRVPARPPTGAAGRDHGRRGRSRPVTWLSLDPLIPLGPAGRDSVQDLDVPPDIAGDYARSGVFAVLGVRTFDGRRDNCQLLARAHPSGQWMEWIA